MFCGQCGAQNDDGANFCKKCGAGLYGVQNTNGGQYISGGQNRKKEAANGTNYGHRKRGIGKSVIGIIAAVVIIGVVIAVIASLSGRGYKAVVDRMVEATFKPDAKAIVELIPKEIAEDEIKKGGYEEDELDQMYEELNEELQDQLDYIEKYLGKDWKLSYELQEIEDITGQDLDDLREEYKEFDLKISAAKKAKVEFTVKADETDISNSLGIALIKIGRSWYLDVASMDDLF